jgi:hypothetical protein
MVSKICPCYDDKHEERAAEGQKTVPSCAHALTVPDRINPRLPTCIPLWLRVQRLGCISTAIAATTSNGVIPGALNEKITGGNVHKSPLQEVLEILISPAWQVPHKLALSFGKTTVATASTRGQDSSAVARQFRTNAYTQMGL